MSTTGSLVDGDMSRTARISADGRYRYILTRRWHPTLPSCTFVALNPSTADADQDDPTIRRCIGFARREGCGGLIVANLCAYRATDPAELLIVDDPFGPGNVETIRSLAHRRDISCYIGAWGAWPDGSRPGAKRGAASMAALVSHWFPLQALGVTAGGQPRHPLYVRADAPLVEYPIPAAGGRTT